MEEMMMKRRRSVGGGEKWEEREEVREFQGEEGANERVGMDH
jgi:hypothetical protein